MSRLTPVNLLTACPEANDILRVLDHPLNDSSNFLQLLANSAAGLEVFLASTCALNDGHLSRRQRVAIALAVSEINGSAYGIAMHHAAAVEAGLTPHEIQNARYGRADDVPTHMLLRFAVAVVLQRGDVSEGDFQALRRAGFDDASVAEIVANIAITTFADLFNNVAQTTIDYPSPNHRAQAAHAAPPQLTPAASATGN